MEADGKTGMTKLTAALRNFANGPKNIKAQLHVPTSLTPSKVHPVPIIKLITDGREREKYQHCKVPRFKPRPRQSASIATEASNFKI
jgi:hypothetical protein